MFAAAAKTPSIVRMPLRGEDCESTRACLSSVGAVFTDENGNVVVHPPTDWQTPNRDLECGNSGTTMRLLAGFLASRPLEAVMTGDASLSRRPMGRIVTPLRLMGAKIEGDTPPLRIRGGELTGIDFHSPVASAQVKSCVLIAGLRADGETWVSEPSQSRDHTERFFSMLGIPLLDRCDGAVGVQGGATWGGFDFTVPADISSAAFAMVAAAMIPGSQLTVRELGLNATRSGLLDVFRQAGVEYSAEMTTEIGEPMGDVTVRGGEGLKAFEIAGALVPRLVDEIPVLAVLATQCRGTTTIRDAKELRLKESDRIQVVADGLRAMGAKMEATADGFVIEGPTPLHGTTIDASGDHRIAMAFAIAAAVADGPVVVRGADSIATSYPDFESDMDRLSEVAHV
jgi:3-phosphoshikimate 1-carboxyvinyltransferase